MSATICAVRIANCSGFGDRLSAPEMVEAAADSPVDVLTAAGWPG